MVPGDNVTLSFLSSARVLDSGGPIYDTTLRFTLSALWNLTDECPEACHAFVAVGGLKIYAKVLKVGALSLLPTTELFLFETAYILSGPSRCTATSEDEV